MDGTIEAATFGMGCFWCGEASFSGICGVLSTRVGYMGGTTEHPSYEIVCSGATGHVEVVEIAYDPSRITYQRLLEVFWDSHNPVGAKEGNGDSGSQYGSVIFFHTEEQKALAEESKRRNLASRRSRGPLTTPIIPASKFWPAEDHHQCYIAKLSGSII